MIEYKTTVHQFEQIEFALEHMIYTIWKLVRICIGELVFDYGLTGGDEAIVRDHTKLFDFGRQQNAGGRHQQWIDAFQ